MANLFLKNIVTKWQSNSVDLQGAYFILGSQTMDQIRNWQVFVDDGKDAKDQWQNIMDCPLIVDLLKWGGETKTETMDIPEEFFNPESHQPISSEELAHSVAADQTATIAQQQEEKYAERRLHPRFDIRLRVIIKSGKHTFLTYTKDVSLGGLSLVNEVPEYIYNTEAEIYMTAPDQKNNLKLICSPVASKLGKSRLMFTNVEEAKQKVLATWLHHVVKPNAIKAG